MSRKQPNPPPTPAVSGYHVHPSERRAQWWANFWDPIIFGFKLLGGFVFLAFVVLFVATSGPVAANPVFIGLFMVTLAILWVGRR